MAKDTDLKTAAKRLVWGKFLNAGQSCVTPDYLVIYKLVKDDLIALLISDIKEFYYLNDHLNIDFTNVIDENNLKLLKDFSC